MDHICQTMEKGRGGLRKIAQRTAKIRKRFDGDTQKVRSNLIFQLQALFEMAQEQALASSGRKGKRQQEWARIAAYISQILANIARGFDNAKVSAELEELEKLIHEQRGKENKRA